MIHSQSPDVYDRTNPVATSQMYSTSSVQLDLEMSERPRHSSTSSSSSLSHAVRSTVTSATTSSTPTIPREVSRSNGTAPCRPGYARDRREGRPVTDAAPRRRTRNNYQKFLLLFSKRSASCLSSLKHSGPLPLLNPPQSRQSRKRPIRPRRRGHRRLRRPFARATHQRRARRPILIRRE